MSQMRTVELPFRSQLAYPAGGNWMPPPENHRNSRGALTCRSWHERCSFIQQRPYATASNLSIYHLHTGVTTMGTANLELHQVIRLKRDETAHAWSMAVADQWKALPWADTADAVSVVMWLKGRLGGTMRVLFEP